MPEWPCEPVAGETEKGMGKYCPRLPRVLSMQEPVQHHLPIITMHHEHVRSTCSSALMTEELAAPPAKRRRMDLPAVGFGTYKLGAETEACVLAALRCGYRLIDTAQEPVF